MSLRLLILDRYILRQMLGTMGGVLSIVMSLMVLEHLARLMEITRLSGHRGYIVMQTVAGLLPEYGGIGLLVGLFLGIALTIRKLSLRGELDVIEACGVAPLRLMRLPVVFAIVVGLLTLANQGWIMPAGEAKLDLIGQRMELGEFGHELPAGQFIDLGPASVLQFREIDTVKGELVDLFLRTPDQTFTAKSGTLSMLPSGATEIVLHHGQVFREGSTDVFEFTRILYRVEGMATMASETPQVSLLKRADIGSLWANDTAASRAVIYGRCMWAALALLLPPMAFVLGKPPRRQSGTVGILVGVTILVLGLKMINPLTDGHTSDPEWLATGILAIWGALAVALLRLERALGAGFVDDWASRLYQNTRRRMEPRAQ